MGSSSYCVTGVNIVYKTRFFLVCVYVWYLFLALIKTIPFTMGHSQKNERATTLASLYYMCVFS